MASDAPTNPGAPDPKTQPATGKKDGTTQPEKEPTGKKAGDENSKKSEPAAGTASSNATTKKKKLKRVRTSGDLQKLRRKMWQTISAAEEIMLDPDSDAATRLKAIHALVQASTAYTRLVESTEQAERIAALEAESDA